MSHRQSQEAGVNFKIALDGSIIATGNAGDVACWHLIQGPSPRAPDSTERGHLEMFNNTAGQVPAASKSGGGAKRGGRPVTWIGGGGLDPKKLAGLGVPVLRTLFHQVFGEPTASNNASWLRRKLSESPDVVHGQRRSAVVRARDMGAAIWNSPLPIVTAADCGDDELGGAEVDHGVMRQDCQGCVDTATADDDVVAGSALLLQCGSEGGCAQGVGRRSLKRSARSAESADTLGYKGSGNNLHYPSSPSGSGSGSPTATHAGSGGVSHRGQSDCTTQPHAVRHLHHHNYHSKGTSSSRHCTHYQPLQQQQLVSSGMHSAGGVGGVIRPELFSDSYQGLKVNVYWPQDHKWWNATICKLDTAACELQLLYSDMTEEAIKGSDFIDLLSKGHLALAAGVAPPHVALLSQGDGKQLQGSDAQVSHLSAAAAAAAAGPSPVELMSGMSHMTDTSWLDSSGASIAAGVRSQSCLLPITLCDSTTSPSELTRSASASFAPRSSGAVTGSSSRAASASFGDFAGLAAKRQCCEASANTPSDGATNRSESFAGFPPAVMPGSTDPQGQGQQQQQEPDTANLGAWFHAQQQQQLQLQVQQSMAQHNMQMQQQMHMAAQLSMQQAAAHFNQMSTPALAAPRATAAGGVCMGLEVAVLAAVARPLPTTSGCLTPVQSPTASSVMPPQPLCSSSPVSGGRSNTALANDIEQLKQLQQRLRLAVGSPSEGLMPGWRSSMASPWARPPAAAVPAVTPAVQATQQHHSWSNQLHVQQQQQEQVLACGQYAPASSASEDCLPAAAAAAAGYVPQVPIVRGYSTPLTSGCFSSGGEPSVWMGMAPVLRKSVSCDAAVVPDVGNIKPEPLAPRLPPPSPPPAAHTFSGSLQVTDCDEIDLGLLAKPGGDMFDLAALGMEQSPGMGEALGDMDGMEMGDGSLGSSDPNSSCGGSLCESLADELVVAGLEVDAAPAYFMFGGSPAMQASPGAAATQGFAMAATAAAPADRGVLVPLGAESVFAHMFDD